MTTRYNLPGLHVTETFVDVPLDWDDEASSSLAVFVREVVDPDRVGDDLPLLVYLQGGPGGANPRPLNRDGWISEALADYRVVLIDQRGTGRSHPIEAADIEPLGAEAGADMLALFRADSIVRDLEHVRTMRYEGRRWATLAQSYGGFLTLTYLSTAPHALTACYVCGGIPGTPPRAEEVYARTFDRVARKTDELYRRFPEDAVTVGRIADLLGEEQVTLPDGDRLTVHRFQSLGIALGMKAGFARLHWLVETAFARPGRLSTGFLQDAMTLTSSAGSPLFWTLQESIYGDPDSGPTAWAAQRARDVRPEFGPGRRPLLFTGEMAFPWMFEEVRLLRGFRDAVDSLAKRATWAPLYDPGVLAASDVPLAATVYFDDMYVDAGLQLDTLARVGNSQYWITNEFEHDGIGSGRTFTALRELVRDRGGERR